MPEYEVIVSNIGTVYRGTGSLTAFKEWCDWVAISKLDFGRGSGESVTELRDGEILREYIPETAYREYA